MEIELELERNFAELRELELDKMLTATVLRNLRSSIEIYDYLFHSLFHWQRRRYPDPLADTDKLPAIAKFNIVAILCLGNTFCFGNNLAIW